MSPTEFTQQDIETIEAAYADLKEAAVKRCANEKELGVVQKAFDFANEAHYGVRRRSGEPYMLHPIAVAKIVVSSIGLGYKSIAAALLHDVVEDTQFTVEDIRNIFGDKIATLVDGLTKIKTVLDKEEKSKESLQAENFKRILLTLNDDIRVVLIKLADRLHNCRTIQYMPEYKREKILSETMFIFIPLAHRLGLYGIKSEMEDIWLRYKEPSAYEQITALVTAKVAEREREIDEFIAPISTILKQVGFDFEIKKRIKTPYSIWHKMQTKGVSFEEIYDIYAVRIIFNSSKSHVLNFNEESYEKMSEIDQERSKCFIIYSLISSIYMEKKDRQRDWLKNPKSNGYEALHCTLMSTSGTWVEVQIRSGRMNDIAEKGIAAHWAYKRNGISSDSESEMEMWINKVKDILMNPDVSSLELLDIIHNDLTTSDIFVFTPQGEQKRIQKGATALDFAYLIHTHIGNQAVAAKVNMKLQPLSYVLRTGDQVEIITAGNQDPKREWLDFLVTRKARNVVSDWFRNKAAENGDTLEEEFKNHPSQKQKSTWNLLRILNKAVSGKEDVVIREDGTTADGKKYKIADCCKPIPGDSVLGFTEDDGTITIHKKTCPVANNIASKFGNRLVVPQWEGSLQKDSLVKLSLKGIDRIGILSEISRIISLVMNMNIREFSLKTSTGGIFDGYMIIYVHDVKELDRLISRLKRIEGLDEVNRKDLI